MELRAK